MKKLILVTALALVPHVAANAAGTTLTVPEHIAGSVDKNTAMEAWSRIYGVVQHPRCANCHTDAENIPMWSGPSYGGKARIHGMNINAGESRIGAEKLPCSTCHVTSVLPNTQPHAAPHTGIDWQLAPVEFVWFGVPEAELCRQLRDPDRNGGRDGEGLIEHIQHDASVHGFIAWGFDPGGGREPAPGSLQSHLNDLALWVAANMPCPGE